MKRLTTQEKMKRLLEEMKRDFGYSLLAFGNAFSDLKNELVEEAKEKKNEVRG